VGGSQMREIGLLTGVRLLVKLHLLLRHAVARPMRYRDFCLAVRL
jgi:hypothetical protein